MRGLLRRLALAILDSLAEPDPWEPPGLQPGEFLVYEREEYGIGPKGSALARCNSARAAFDFVNSQQLNCYFLLTRTEDGRFEYANEKDAFRLLWQRRQPAPSLSPGEVAALLVERESRAA